MDGRYLVFLVVPPQHFHGGLCTTGMRAEHAVRWGSFWWGRPWTATCSFCCAGGAFDLAECRANWRSTPSTCVVSQASCGVLLIRPRDPGLLKKLRRNICSNSCFLCVNLQIYVFFIHYLSVCLSSCCGLHTSSSCCVPVPSPGPCSPTYLHLPSHFPPNVSTSCTHVNTTTTTES